MSRKGSVRRDPQIVRKLREAADNPASLLNEGSSILQKADKISGFLAQQKTRTTAASGKSEWLLVHASLQEEREACEKELTSALLPLAENTRSGLTETSTDALASLRASAEECSSVRVELKEQLKSLSKAVHELRASPSDPDPDPGLRIVESQLKILEEDLDLQVVQLKEEGEKLEAEIRELQRAEGGGCAQFGPSPMEEWYEEGMSCMSRYPLASEGIKMGVIDVFKALAERYFEKKTALDQSTVPGNEQGLPYGGWAQEEHSQFVKLRERYLKEVGTGAVRSIGGKGIGGAREAAMTKVSQLIPGRSLASVLSHDDWFVAWTLLQRRKKDASDAWARERASFIEDSEKLLEESEVSNHNAAALAAERLAHELVREQLREELEELKAQKLLEWEAGAEERALAEIERAERMEHEARDFARIQAEKREMIAVYKIELDKKMQEEQAAREEKEREEVEQREAAKPYHKGRVEVRKKEYQDKLSKQQEQAREEEEKKRRQQERLDALRALVAPTVESDPTRVWKATEASSAQSPEDEQEVFDSQAFKPVHGYTSTQIYKDARFKLTERLQAAGLHTTAAGRQAIALAQTAKPTRPDNLTWQQRAGGSHQ